MNTQRFVIAITVVNFALLASISGRIRSVTDPAVTPVLRGRALEITDEQGRLRASISVLPAGPAKPVPNGKIYPETVILRLIDPNGRPSVKLTASEQGSALGLGGRSDETYAVLQAEGPDSSLKLTNHAGRRQVLAP